MGKVLGFLDLVPPWASKSYGMKLMQDVLIITNIFPLSRTYASRILNNHWHTPVPVVVGLLGLDLMLPSTPGPWTHFELSSWSL